jgi:hypothetical protein
MSTVRGAIAAYLTTGIAQTNAAIPGLNQVYRGMPVFIDPTRWWQLPPELDSGTIVYLHLAKIDDERIAEPATQGVKLVEYLCAIVAIYKYQVPDDTQTTLYQGDEWVDGYDTTMEALKAYIRDDPNLGTAQVKLFSQPPVPGVIYAQFPEAIWQAGQVKGDLSMSADLPMRDEDSGDIFMFQVIELHVTETITA